MKGFSPREYVAAMLRPQTPTRGTAMPWCPLSVQNLFCLLWMPLWIRETQSLCFLRFRAHRYRLLSGVGNHLSSFTQQILASVMRQTSTSTKTTGTFYIHLRVKHRASCADVSGYDALRFWTVSHCVSAAREPTCCEYLLFCFKATHNST